MSGRILEMLQKEEENYHPLVAIHRISAKTEDQRLAFDCHRTIAKYVEAERKSIDIKTEDGAELVHLTIDVGDKL
jgi:hypothetical protein